MAEEINVGSTPVYVAHPEGEIKGGLIVIHEVWGLNDHTKDVAERFAREGYLTYAPDLMAGTGIEDKITPELQQDLFNPEKRNSVQPKLRELMAPIQSPEFAERTTESLKQIFDVLYDNPDTKGRVAVLGYCFGGTYSFNLAIKEPKLVAAVPYYGHCDHPLEQLRQIACPVLAFYGEKDENLIATLPELEEKMHEAGVDFTAQVYTNCGHAFFNDTNPFAYNREAADDAWKRTLEFLNGAFSR